MKRIIIVILTVLAVFAMSGCSSVNTQPDEVALHYKGGAASSAKFANCVDSSSRNFDGPGDDHYTYPKGQRTFSFTGAAGSEVGPIKVTTKDGQLLSVPGFVTFTLNTDCKTLQDFHERVGIKYEAYDNDQGWNAFLNDYINVPLTSAMNQASLNTDWRTLYSDAATQVSFEEFVKTNLPDEVVKALGADYITINAVEISKPLPEDGLLKGLAAKEEARLTNDAQKQKNEVARTKYDSFKDCTDAGIGEQTCLTLKLAEEGNISFYPVPQGGSIVVSPGR